MQGTLPTYLRPALLSTELQSETVELLLPVEGGESLKEKHESRHRAYQL